MWYNVLVGRFAQRKQHLVAIDKEIYTMAKPNGTKNPVLPNQPKGKVKPTERRVPFETLEAWLIVATDRSTDPNERLGWLQSAIAWTLGKDSTIATEIMTRQFKGNANNE